MKVKEIIKIMNDYAPETAACEWDNSGLQIGSEDNEVSKVLVCLDVTPKVVEEAVSAKAQLIVSHHPFFFFAVNKITDDEKSSMIRAIIKNDINVYSSHTCFDASKYGINAYCAFRLGIETDSFLENSSEEGLGIGVCGNLRQEVSFEALCNSVKKIFKAETLKVSAFVDKGKTVKRAAFCGGAGASYLKKAKELGADVLITADASNGKFLEAENIGLPLITMTHFESESCFVKIMRDILLKETEGVEVLESSESDREIFV